MSIRSKAANTLGPDSNRPVLRKYGINPLYPDSTSDRVPLVLGAWLMEDPLSSTANLAFSSGTWDTASGYLNIANPASNIENNVRHTYAIDPVLEKHVVQVEMGIPSNFQSGVECHMDVGFNTTSWSNDAVYFCARSRGSTVRASWLRKAIVWVDGPTYAFADGTWYTMRMVWDTVANMFTGYINGAQVTTYAYTQSESSKVLTLDVYKSSGTHANAKFRNLKYWGGGAADTMP